MTVAEAIDKPPRLHQLRKMPKLSTCLETLTNFLLGFSFCLQLCLRNISARTCVHVDQRPITLTSSIMSRLPQSPFMVLELGPPPLNSWNWLGTHLVLFFTYHIVLSYLPYRSSILSCHLPTPRPCVHH